MVTHSASFCEEGFPGGAVAGNGLFVVYARYRPIECGGHPTFDHLIYFFSVPDPLIRKLFTR